MKCDNTREHKKVIKSVNGWKKGRMDVCMRWVGVEEWLDKNASDYIEE